MSVQCINIGNSTLTAVLNRYEEWVSKDARKQLDAEVAAKEVAAMEIDAEAIKPEVPSKSCEFITAKYKHITEGLSTAHSVIFNSKKRKLIEREYECNLSFVAVPFDQWQPMLKKRKISVSNQSDLRRTS